MSLTGRNPKSVFLSPSRHTMLLTQRSDQCSKTLSCRFPSSSRHSPLPVKGSNGAARGVFLPQGCGPQEQFFHQQQSQSPAALPEQQCSLGGCPYPQLSSSPALPPDLPGGFRRWWFQPQDWFSEEGLVVEIEEKKQHINRIFLFTAPRDSNPWQVLFSVASGGKAAIRRPKVT